MRLLAWHGSIRAAVALAWASALLTRAATSAGAGDCESATRELTQAQQALAKALRDSDTTGEAYATCMAKGSGCAAQKAAYDSACSATKKATLALRAKVSERDAVCDTP